jgi:hypothetical protein
MTRYATFSISDPCVDNTAPQSFEWQADIADV